MARAKRFFLDSDDSGHWYVVPLDKQEEWSVWRNIPEDDERSWNAPEWAERVNGSPNRISFTNPRDDE